MKSAFFLALFFPLFLHAHPDPRHTLEHLEEHLKETPNDPALLAEKADLLIAADQPALARPVIDKLLGIAPSEPAYLLLDAKLSLEEKNPATHTKAVGLTGAHPGFAPGWRFLSRVEEENGNRDAAISAMVRNLSLNPKPTPSDIMTCAAWLNERGQSGDKEDAILQLDQGLAKLGVLSGLHYQAVEMELELGRFDSALRRIDALVARFRPSADLSLRRADILEKAARFKEAAGACDSALAILDSLPTKRKQSAQFKSRFEEIEARKQKNLAKVDVPQ